MKADSLMESENFSLLPDHKPSAIGFSHVRRGCPATVWPFSLWQKATDSSSFLMTHVSRFTFHASRGYYGNGTGLAGLCVTRRSTHL
jgi:hypothetical protein